MAKPYSKCIHRIDAASALDCGCAGIRELFECKKIPHMNCVTRPLSRPGRVIGQGIVLTGRDVSVCGPDTCDMYTPEGTQ